MRFVLRKMYENVLYDLSASFVLSVGSPCVRAIRDDQDASNKRKQEIGFETTNFEIATGATKFWSLSKES